MGESKGFIVVASKEKRYLTYAQFLCDSLKDYCPDTPVALFTEPDWISDEGNSLFDMIFPIESGGVRAKLEVLSKTPFDITCYLDADMVCLHDDAEKVFAGLGDKDIVFTKIRKYAAAKTWWDLESETGIHGGFFVWRKTDRMTSFMEQWWSNWKWKMNHGWDERWTGKYIPSDVSFWDQFPLHLMLQDKDDPWYRGDIDWGWIYDGHQDSRWNYMYVYTPEREGLTPDEIVFYSFPQKR